MKDQSASPKSDTDVRLAALCARLGVDFVHNDDPRQLGMWANIGLKLALNEPEFRSRSRGRPKQRTPSPMDQKIILAAEMVARDAGFDFDQALGAFLKLLEKKRMIPVADRTTHKKRLKRAKATWDATRKKWRETLARALLERDKNSK